MPNLAIKQKSGFIPFTRNYTDDYLNFVEILNTLGSTQEYDESLFHIITAIYGSGPAWYFELSAKIVNSAVNLGMDESDAKILVSNLLSSLPHLTGEKDFDEIVASVVGDLDKSPEVSCVYHSEDAENQFMKDPTKAVLGDGVVQSMRERVDAQSDMKAFR